MVSLKPGAEATEEELIAFCREHLATYKCPKSVDVLEALPRNPTGKILKREPASAVLGGAGAPGLSRTTRRGPAHPQVDRPAAYDVGLS